MEEVGELGERLSGFCQRFQSQLRTQTRDTIVYGELYLPERWFSAAYAEQRQALCIPEQLTFQKKPELGWQMIQRVQKRAIPFQAVVMDDLYGRNEEMCRSIPACISNRPPSPIR